MLDKVHQHIINELQQAARTDTIFVLTSVLFNLIVLAINSAVAGSAVSEHGKSSDDVILIVFIMMILVVNWVSVKALSSGKSTRNRLLNGLISMYKDNDVNKYYDPTILDNYGKRYSSFTIVILSIALTAIIVPLVIRFL
jgi:hypothetical protein